MSLIRSASLGVILSDAFLAINIALCFAEVGGNFKNNGGPYIYTKEFFGTFTAFEVGFMTYAICIIAAATMVVGFATALSVFFQGASHGITKDILIIGLLILPVIMNLAGVNLSKIVINVSTIGKLIHLVIFMAVGIFFTKYENFTPLFLQDTYMDLLVQLLF